MNKDDLIEQLQDIFHEVMGCVISIEQNIAPHIKSPYYKRFLYGESRAIDKCMSRLEIVLEQLNKEDTKCL
jgi:hypothetical protein